METQPTCGRGLAEHSVLPAKLGEWAAAVAENLTRHTEALDLTDESSSKERDAYLDLAMGRHDPKAMTSSRLRDSFEKFVRLEQELLGLLQKRVEQDRQMLIAVG